jgi:YD repeat-containing protein
MACIRHIAPYRLVGDPVDVVTGANLEEKNDFQLPGPIPFVWTRHYSSDHHGWQRALGWGHTHEYDAFLKFDLDGMQYVGPTGETTYFAFLETDGDEVRRAGYRLVRLRETVYQIHPVSGPAMQFVFTRFDKPAQLTELIQNNHRVRFNYDQNGGLRSVRLADRRTLIVKSDEQKRIVSIALQESGESQPSRFLAGYAYDDAGNLVEGL